MNQPYPRELTSRENTIISPQQPREVLKEKNIKICNYSSHEGEDESGNGVSAETQPLASSANATLATPETSSSLGRETVSQEEDSNNKPAARTITRVFSAITAQHVRSKSGVKVGITLQTPAQAENAEFNSITAELKRHTRLRELKAYEPDSDAFAKIYREIVETIQSYPMEDREFYCVGRLHERGRRTAWISDMLLVGYLNAVGHLSRIILYSGSEEYSITMNHELSERQSKSYFTAGIFGQLRMRRAEAPSLATLETRRFK